MKKWEYIEEWVSETANILGLSQRLGQDGWEIAIALPLFGGKYPIIFKRETPEPLEPPEFTARRQAVLEILHDESLSPEERVSRALQAALGEIPEPTKNEHPSQTAHRDVENALRKHRRSSLPLG